MLLEQYPEAVIEKDSFGRLPLHHACQYAPKGAEVISFFIERHPWACQARDDLGDTPLHLVCRFGPTMEVIELLFQKHPEAVQEKNNDGNTPFHLVSLFHRDNTEVILFMIKMDPGGL